MATVVLGKTGIKVNKNGFGALPIQRVSKSEATRLIHKAYDGGITFFDTARSYTDSEEKLGAAFEGIRNNVVIATKSPAEDAESFNRDLETSLTMLKTDYIDIFQFHNPAFCPKPNDGTGLYEAMLKAKKQGKIRFIGITNHRLAVANEAINSDLYDTMQFPFCYLSTQRDIDIVEGCRAHNMGFISMKALSGGLITNARAAAAFFEPYSHVIPIWGIQRERELDDFLKFIADYPKLTDTENKIIRRDREQLSGNFCRGCGYCEPTCPQKIHISDCARRSLLIRRSPSKLQLTEAIKAEMEKAKSCIDCGICKTKCPYNLDTPALLRENIRDYEEILNGKEL